jgi:hypothetical protein
VAFDEAASVFFNSLSVTGNDPDHSHEESRFVTFGMSSSGRLLESRILTAEMPFELSLLARRHPQRGVSMKKAKRITADELRPEYKRSDFGPLVRGEYVERLRKSSNVVVLDPEVAELFPNAEAVNAALRSLAEIAKCADSRRN